MRINEIAEEEILAAVIDHLEILEEARTQVVVVMDPFHGFAIVLVVEIDETIRLFLFGLVLNVLDCIKCISTAHSTSLLISDGFEHRRRS